MNQTQNMQPEALPAVQRTYQRVASTYTEHAGLLEILSARLLDRLDMLAIKPLCVVDLGCGTGVRLKTLQKRYPQASVMGIDASAAMLQEFAGVSGARGSFSDRLLAGMARAGGSNEPWRVQADAQVMPLADASVDLIVASQLLPWCNSPKALFVEMFRVLKPGGAVFWSSAGPDTLREYRELWQNIDTYPHHFGLIDMHDLGDDMLAAGFDAPVLDRENISVSYTSVDALQAELRGVGCSNLAMGRRRGLMASNIPRRLRAQLPSRLPADSGDAGSAAISMTLELIQGHGWKREGVQPSNIGVTATLDSLADGADSKTGGSFSVSIDALRKALKKPPRQ